MTNIIIYDKMNIFKIVEGDFWYAKQTNLYRRHKSWDNFIE